MKIICDADKKICDLCGSSIVTDFPEYGIGCRNIHCKNYFNNISGKRRGKLEKLKR